MNIAERGILKTGKGKKIAVKQYLEIFLGCPVFFHSFDALMKRTNNNLYYYPGHCRVQ